MESTFLQIKMTENQQLLYDAVKTISHLDVHAKTTATIGQQESFRSVWFRHTPSAARYMLFAQLCDGRIELTNEHPPTDTN